MKFLLEKIDLSEIKQLYFLRGYENKEDNNYCMSMALLGDDNDEFTIKLLLSQKTLSIKEGKNLLKYLKGTGLKLVAEVLKSDFERFYNTKS
ncbi:MAG: hypothetical protein IMY74_11410, partial [Bacteroidetes bacterium]|nr:hypothetical protein [Bacteroidota bacterium]